MPITTKLLAGPVISARPLSPSRPARLFKGFFRKKQDNSPECHEKDLTSWALTETGEKVKVFRFCTCGEWLLWEEYEAKKYRIKLAERSGENLVFTTRKGYVIAEPVEWVIGWRRMGWRRVQFIYVAGAWRRYTRGVDIDTWT